MINLQQKGPITEHIQQFQNLSLGVKNIPKDNFLDLSMCNLKENNGVETQSYMGSILSQVDNTNNDYQNHSSLEDPHH